ncbi:MAG: hypothetical protein J6H18_04075 [Lachnospiraceae bacterium]|nr:hypothetical protein [Lachnospiraceae bacterium]
MKETKLNKAQYQDHPYGLHDAVITEIRMKGETVELHFKGGIIENKEPFAKTGPALIEVRNVDPDFCTVSWFKTTEKEKLRGKRMALTDFLPVRLGGGITIVSEAHGYNRVCYRGVMFRKKKGSRTRKMVEVELDLYFFGDLVYKLKEE